MYIYIYIYIYKFRALHALLSSFWLFIFASFNFNYTITQLHIIISTFYLTGQLDIQISAGTQPPALQCFATSQFHSQIL